MYYHASRTGNIKKLEPRISNHGIPLVYFSTKPENTLVYLSNAVEKFCKLIIKITTKSKRLCFPYSSLRISLSTAVSSYVIGSSRTKPTVPATGARSSLMTQPI